MSRLRFRPSTTTTGSERPHLGAGLSTNAGSGSGRTQRVATNPWLRRGSPTFALGERANSGSRHLAPDLRCIPRFARRLSFVRVHRGIA
jgi:SRSO17 transposase